MAYEEQESEALLYNLYADKLLQLGLVPDEVCAPYPFVILYPTITTSLKVYDIQTAYIGSQFRESLLSLRENSWF